MKNHQKPSLKPFLAPENCYLDRFSLYFYDINLYWKSPISAIPSRTGGHNNFLGSKKHEKWNQHHWVQIFSKIRQLLKNHYLRGFLTGSRVVLFSTRRIVRGGAIWPPKKTHKDMCDRCKNCRGLEVVNSSTKMQFQVNWSIFAEIRPVWILVVSLCRCQRKLANLNPINVLIFLYKSFSFRFFSLKVKFTEN